MSDTHFSGPNGAFERGKTALKQSNQRCVLDECVELLEKLHFL